MNTSKEAYDAAVARYKAASQAGAEALKAAEVTHAAYMAAAKAIVDATDELEAHEAAPGIPAYEHIASRADCRLHRCSIHKAGPVTLDDVTAASQAAILKAVRP